MEIVKGYKNYEDIKNIHFDSLYDFSTHKGKFVDETKHEIGMFSSEDSVIEEGVYIYQDENNPRKALRVYKDIVDYKFTYHTDDRLVSELQKRQPNVKLSEFPSAVVTIEDKVVGQEIPYYPNTITLLRAFKTGNLNGNIPTKYLIDMLKIQRELLVNGIISSDCHPKNFIIEAGLLKPIDFEDKFVFFDDEKFHYDIMIDTLKHGLIGLSKIASLPLDETIDFKEVKELDELSDIVNEMDYKLKRNM